MLDPQFIFCTSHATPSPQQIRKTENLFQLLIYLPATDALPSPSSFGTSSQGSILQDIFCWVTSLGWKDCQLFPKLSDLRISQILLQHYWRKYIYIPTAEGSEEQFLQRSCPHLGHTPIPPYHRRAPRWRSSVPAIASSPNCVISKTVCPLYDDSSRASSLCWLQISSSSVSLASLCLPVLSPALLMFPSFVLSVSCTIIFANLTFSVTYFDVSTHTLPLLVDYKGHTLLVSFCK